MSSWITECIDQYYDWLRKNTFLQADSQTGWTSISTPFTGLFNDAIEIFVKREGDIIMLSDDGVTLRNLGLVGVNVNRAGKRKEWLEYVLLNYGITLDSGELRVEAKMTDFAQKKHNLICAISELSDMEISAKHIVSSLFIEDIRKYLNEQEVIYTPQFIAKGKTGIDFTFDFQLAGRNKEMVIKSFNTLNRLNVPNFLFGFEDIKSLRETATSKELLSLAIVNDEDRDIKPEFISAFESKDVDILYWSKRNSPDSLQLLKKVS